MVSLFVPVRLMPYLRWWQALCVSSVPPFPRRSAAVCRRRCMPAEPSCCYIQNACSSFLSNLNIWAVLSYFHIYGAASCAMYSINFLIICSRFPQPAHAAVHQIAHRLVVDAHNLADIVVFALLYIIKVYGLLLSQSGFMLASVISSSQRCVWRRNSSLMRFLRET